jgi:hypothetical protein
MLNLMAAAPQDPSRFDTRNRKFRTNLNFRASPILLVWRRIFEEAHFIHRQQIHFGLTSPLLIPLLQNFSVRRINLITSIGISDYKPNPEKTSCAAVAHGERVMDSWSVQQLTGYVTEQLETLYDEVTIRDSYCATSTSQFGERSKEFTVWAKFSNKEAHGSDLVKKWEIER